MMDSSLNYVFKRDGDERDTREADFCGPLHRSGDCNYINCSFSVDHYHCQFCGSGAIEVSCVTLPIELSNFPMPKDLFLYLFSGFSSVIPHSHLSDLPPRFTGLSPVLLKRANFVTFVYIVSQRKRI